MRILERGYIVRFEPQARGYEPPCASARAEMIRKIRIGAGGFQALSLTGRLLLPQFGLIAFAFWGHKLLRWCVPFFLLAALAANIVLCAVPAMAAVLALQGVGMGIAVLAYRAVPGASLPRWTRPLSYFYVMNYALLCGFIRFLSNTQRVTWDRSSEPAAAALPVARTTAPLLLRRDLVE